MNLDAHGSKTIRSLLLLAYFNTISLVRLKDPVRGSDQECVFLSVLCIAA